MARELKATRYLRPGNEDLAHFISSKLHYLDFPTTLEFYDTFLASNTNPLDYALLGANDRFFLFTHTLGRMDAVHPWLYGRCREVEDEPDECLDLWAREHYKSSLITFAGSIQEVIIDPEIKIGIFSFNQGIARDFLNQIKQELQDNERLKIYYPDVFWADPRKQAPRWSLDKGLVVRRQGNPKESTIEGHGLIEAQPTGRHFDLRIYDDIITLKYVTNVEMVQKATMGWEMSDNLGSNQPDKPARRWHVGTRYSFGDTYGQILERKILKPRLYPATDNGQPDGEPVYWTQEIWEKKKRDQVSTYAAQLLQNPAAGNEAMFKLEWLETAAWLIRPTTLNVYIMGDPSAGLKRKDSDRTAIVAVGIDANHNLYLLDGYCHRMALDERWSMLWRLRKKWINAPGVRAVSVGWERYGYESDIQYFDLKMKEIGQSFTIEELNWAREGGQSKEDRVGRLQPAFVNSSFYLPGVVHHEGFGAETLWKTNLPLNRIDYEPLKGPTRAMRAVKAQRQEYLIAKPIMRRDENGNIYDLTRRFFEEYLFFPFSSKKDLIDATSRIFDMNPVPPVVFEKPVEDYVPDYYDA